MIGNDINIFIRRTMNDSLYFTMLEEEGEGEGGKEGRRERESLLTSVIHHHCQLGKALNFYYYYVCFPARLGVWGEGGGNNNGNW